MKLKGQMENTDRMEWRQYLKRFSKGFLKLMFKADVQLMKDIFPQM